MAPGPGLTAPVSVFPSHSNSTVISILCVGAVPQLPIQIPDKGSLASRVNNRISTPPRISTKVMRPAFALKSTPDKRVSRTEIGSHRRPGTSGDDGDDRLTGLIALPLPQLKV